MSSIPCRSYLAAFVFVKEFVYVSSVLPPSVLHSFQSGSEVGGLSGFLNQSFRSALTTDLPVDFGCYLVVPLEVLAELAFFDVRVGESGAEVVKIFASVVVGVGIDVNYYRIGMNGGIGRGMVVPGADEVSGITITGMNGGIGRGMVVLGADEVLGITITGMVRSGEV
nr:hypothetical protein [Tanacetum cinerariifolium]